MNRGVHLSLMMGPVVPVPAPAPVTEALTRVQVTTAAGQRSGFQLTFSLGKKSPLNLALIPAGFFDPGIRVVLTVVVGGMPTVLMDGVITRQQVTAADEPGQSQLTVTGEDLTVLMDLHDRSGEPYPAMTDSLIVLRILAEYALYGMIPLVIPELFSSPKAPVQSFRHHQGTHLAYIQELARQHGYVFYLEPGPAPGASIAYFGPEIRIGIPQPALSVNMDAHSNVDSLSFSFDGLSREQVVAWVQIPATKLSIPIPVPDVSLLSPPLALRQAPSLRTATAEGLAKRDAAEAAGRALAQAAASSKDAVTGTGSLDVVRYGRVLHARRLVGVRGAGIAYDGFYFVKSVTHSIERGSYKQNFTLARNGLISSTVGVPV